MDMRQFMLSGGQKLFLVVVLDIFLRRIVGWHLSHRCRTTTPFADFPEEATYDEPQYSTPKITPSRCSSAFIEFCRYLSEIP